MPLTRKRGRYWYGFTRVNGVSGDEQSTGCKTRAAAAKVLAQWERDAADPHSAAKSRATLDDALGRMIRSCEELTKTRPPKLSESTLVSHAACQRIAGHRRWQRGFPTGSRGKAAPANCATME